MALGGKLLTATRKQVEGTYKQHAWSDDWQESIDIAYDGELTPSVQEAITKAFYASKHATKIEGSWGKLRWSSPDRVSHVDVEKKQLIINCSQNLCD